MRIIDTRFRPGTPDTFRGILSNPLYKSFSETTNFAARPTASLDEEVAMLRGLGVTRAVVMAASTPPAALRGMCAAKFDRDVSLAPSLVAVQTLLSMITMPMVLGLAKFLV